MVAQAVHPLTSSQHEVLLDQLRNPQAPHWNIGVVIQIDGDLDVQRLAAAIHQVTARHDALRIVLDQRPGIVAQRILPLMEIALPFVDYCDVAGGSERAWQYVEEIFRKSFDLKGNQLWEMQLIRVGPQRYLWLNRYHHVIVDGFSVALICAAVADSYNWAEPADDSRAPAPSYLEILAKDSAYRASARYHQDRRFWRERFAEIPPPLFSRSFGAGHQDAVTKSEQVVWSAPRELFERIRAQSSRSGLSTTHFLLALLSVYFARAGGAEEVVVGLHVHNRGTAREKTTVGMLSSILPIRIRVDLKMSFVELMRAVAAELRRCHRHQRLSIGQINRDLQLARHGRSQLFDLTLSVESFSPDLALGGARYSVIALHPGVLRTALAIFVRDYHDAEDVKIEFNFNMGVLEREEVQRMQSHLAYLVKAACDDENCPVGRLQLQDEMERRRLLHEFNATQATYPRDRLIHQLFETHAEKTPNAPAVVHEDRCLTYGELDNRANQLARYLQAQGVRTGSIVAICAERSFETIVGLLGILKCGGAYLPLDPAHPGDRIAYMLADARPHLLLTQERLMGRLPKMAAGVIALDADWAVIARQDSSRLEPTATAAASYDLAYVIYTSGSTGQPKGVMVEHAGVLNILHSLQDQLEVTAADCMLSLTTLSFDIAALEIFLPLVSGGKLALASDHVIGNVPKLIEMARKAGVTMLQATPSMWRLLLQERLDGHARLTALCGGETLTKDLCEQLMTQVDELWNLYGPTETTIWSCGFKVNRGVQEYAESIPIGRPIANTRIYILDEFGEPVPIGVAGEICIAGAGVARGYWNRPELTAERFVADPFGMEAGARMYRSGDLGRYLPDGTIQFLGRRDDQVKLRGYRIELGEIEAQLARHAGVKEAVVVLREEAGGEKRLVAYYTGEAAVEVEELQSHLKSLLPEYMVPAAFVWLLKLPLTPNGKLDRKGLPAPEGSAYRHQRYEAPQGRIECALAQIWQELLQVERVGRQDNFFDLGGHSLLAVQMVARVRHALCHELMLGELFESATLQAVAERLDTSTQVTPNSIARAKRDQPLPLSYAQQRLWFVDKLEGASAAYHMPAGLRLRGRLNLEALRAALDRLVERHEILRTRFVSVGGEPRQVIAEVGSKFALTEVDLRELQGAVLEAQVAERSRAEAHRPFDLSAGPMIRGQLLRLDEEEHVLLLTQHHIISDGWSIGVLVKELSALYGAFSRGEPDPLPALRVQYADYALWQRQRLQGEALRGQIEFWQEHLRGAPALLELPTDRPRPAVQSYRGDRVWFSLGADLSDKVKALSRRFDATLFMTLYTGFAVLLSRLSGQSDVVIGTSVANRPDSELEGLIGFFVNALALRMHLRAKTSIADLIRQARALALSAYSHQEIPFEQVAEAVQPLRTLSHSPIFQVLLTLQNTPHGELRLPGLTLFVDELSNGTAQFDLIMSLQETAGGIQGHLTYASDLFHRETIERWIGHFKTVLEAMVEDVQRELRSVSLLSASERRRLLQEFNADTETR